MNPRLSNLTNFIRDRHAIYLAKTAGAPKPWTDDPILQSYRFCNVYRELDTVTRWLRESWYPKINSRDLIVSACLARYINWPDTLSEIGPRNATALDEIHESLKSRRLRGEKVYTGAYMIRSDRDTPHKEDYICRVIGAVIEAGLRWGPESSLETAHAELMRLHGWGSFLAAQVICDLKYTALLAGTPDWWAFAAKGPGSARGLNRILGRDKDTPWRAGEWEAELASLQKEIDPQIKKLKMPRLHAQDLQNCLCEFDKYERVRLGEGRPRSLYNGRGD